MQDKKQNRTKESLIKLADEAKVKGIRGLADYLGENENKLYSWIRKNNIADVRSILAKFPNISIDWIRTGTGPMFVETENIKLSLARIAANAPWRLQDAEEINDNCLTDYDNEHFVRKSVQLKKEKARDKNDKDINMTELVTKTMEILESTTVYKSALAANIRAFHKAVITENDMNDLRKDIAEMKEHMEKLEEMLRSMGAIVPQKRDQANR